MLKGPALVAFFSALTHHQNLLQNIWTFSHLISSFMVLFYFNFTPQISCSFYLFSVLVNCLFQQNKYHKFIAVGEDFCWSLKRHTLCFVHRHPFVWGAMQQLTPSCVTTQNLHKVGLEFLQHLALSSAIQRRGKGRAEKIVKLNSCQGSLPALY